MVLPHTISIKSKYRSRLTYCSLVLTISLPLVLIQAPDAYCAGKEVKSYNCSINPAQADQHARRLEQGNPVERELTGGQSHSYQITLAADQYVKLIVDQRGIDLVVKLFGPDGKPITEFDSERRVQGEETVQWVAEEAGVYRLDVPAKYKNAAAGRYRIQVMDMGIATESDRALHEARKLNSEFSRLYQGGKYDEALPLGERILEIRERTLGSDHPDVARSVHNLALLYDFKGDFARSEPLYQRALVIRERVLGPEHPDVASSLNNLALLYSESGDYAKAELFFGRALTIGEKALGPEHPDVAASLTSLAKLYYEIGEYKKAEPHFERALVIWEKALGSEHPLVTLALNNLAGLYKMGSDYAKAEPLFRRALNIDEKVRGPEHPDVASSLINLANLYYEKGDYEKAEPLYGRAVTIREKALGAEHPDLARPLENLADLYKDRGEYAKAEPLYGRALAIREKALGLEHPFVALTLDNLARLYSERGDYARAEPLYQRALAIGERAVGPEHPGVAQVLNDLANLYRARGDYARAEPLYGRALAIREKALGREHTDFTESLTDLARLHAAKGDYAQAVSVLAISNDIEERNFVNNLRTGSERQKLAYLALFSKQTDFTLSLHSQAAAQTAANGSQALNLAFTTLLRRKGRGLDAMTDTIAALRSHATPQVQALFDRLTQARSQLATLILRGPDATRPDTYRRRVKYLKVEVDDLEAELSSRSIEFRKQMQPVTLSAVRAVLPAGSALVEFAYFTPPDPKTGKDMQPRYLAYALAPQGEPKWVDLGEAALIDQAIDEWRKALRSPNRTDVERFARAVDEKVMRPVRSLLREMPGEARRLLIAPDGSLNLIPFAALVDEQNQYLIEHYSISYLTSGGDLLRLQTSEPSKGAPLVVANPDFGRFTTVAMRGGRGKPHARNQSRAQIDPTQIFFQPLPATEDEALAIKVLLPNASMLQGEDATETALKQTRGPQILHIATHGFFINKRDDLPADDNSPRVVSSGTTGLASTEAIPYTVQLEATPALKTAQETVKRLRAQGVDAYILKSRAKGKGVFFRVRAGKFPAQADANKYGADLQQKGLVSGYFVARYVAEPLSDLRLSILAAQVKDPLLRSGLALAGANHGKSGEDDGVLTALEAAYLDLSGTKLVVLSACDTGVGEVKNGEGVQGLRRALVLAGSESQVMSLWPVSDEATKDMMIPYYKALQQGEGRSEGLRQVQLRMLHGRKDRRHPFYWAAFIQSGEWANLDGQR
jgi:CHAT domain-containing protein/Tfp pilus assembly protein PilF